MKVLKRPTNQKNLPTLKSHGFFLGVRSCPSCPSYYFFLHISRVTGLSAAKIGHTHPGQVLISDLINGLPPSLNASHGRFDFPPPQVIEFSQVQHHAEPADGEHEHQEHRLLRGSGDVALDIFYAGVAITFVHGRDVESIQEVLTHQKAYFQRVSEHHLDDVKPGDALLSPHFGLCSSHCRIRDLFDF